VEHLDAWKLILLFAVGLASGFVNVLAGGGSFLTLPVLIFLGLPPGVANGTNRIGILIQNVGAIWSFRRRGFFPVGLSAALSIPAVLGAIIGAKVAVAMGDEGFRRSLALVMLGVTLLTLWNPVGRDEKMLGGSLQPTPGQWAFLTFAFFGVGLYGGFVQAGVGFFVIAALAVTGLDLIRINAIKLIVILILTFPALAVFLVESRVDWALGALLGAGNFLGAQVSTRLAVQKGHAWIRHVVTVTVVLMALRLLFG